MEMTNEVVVLAVECERCDGRGCDFCFGMPETVRTRHDHRLCEHVQILRDMDGSWLDVECDAGATYRLEFDCAYEGMAGPQRCEVFVCGAHRGDATTDLATEDTVLTGEVHRADGFPVIGGVISGPETMGCPLCATEEGWTPSEAWDASYDPHHDRRNELPQREVVEEFTAFPADPTSAYKLSCGHTVL